MSLRNNLIAFGNLQKRALQSLYDRFAGVESWANANGYTAGQRPDTIDLRFVGTVTSASAGLTKLAFSPPLFTQPDGFVFHFKATDDLTLDGSGLAKIQLDANTALNVKDARGNAIIAGAWEAGQLVTATVVGSEIRINNWLNPVVSNWIAGDAVWDAVNNSYNITTGNGLADATVAVGQHFRIIPDTNNPSGGTTVKIDGMTARTIKYQYKSNKYDLLAGEVAQNSELLIRWDGTDFVAVCGLAIPNIVETAIGPVNDYVYSPVGVSFDAPLSSISGSGQLATLASNVLTIKQPGLYEQRCRGGFNYAGSAINFSGDSLNSNAATTGYQEYTVTRTMRMEAGDTVSVEFYLYNGAAYYPPYSQLGVKFLGRL